ncbi:hypothetical protein F2Q70_00037420 [Brassica cretica]|uniref:Uncharacterized protein n=1 Tax=Brassica cretica TaxID=69181 RepID=A0A8S9JRR8_BRACR|nr:hypothetical protein F2Q70_00037420 [Brassica cretica]
MLGTASPWLGQSLFVFDFVFFVIGLPSIVSARFGFQDLVFGVMTSMLSFIARGRLHSFLISLRLPFPLYSCSSLQLSSHLWWLSFSPCLPLEIWIMFSFVYVMWAWNVISGLKCAELVSWSFGPFYPELCGFSVACRLVCSCLVWLQHLGKKLKSILTFSDLSLASRESLSVLRLVSPSLEPCLSFSTLLSLLGLSVSHSILSSIRFSLQSLGSLTLLDRRSSLVPPVTLASESSPSEEPSPAPAQALVSQMDIMSLNNDDDYMSEHEDSEQEMDENNPVVDESLMSTAEMVKGGCDLDEEDKEDLDEEAEESGKKRTRLN